jgi:pilus assembly protein CpaF
MSSNPSPSLESLILRESVEDIILSTRGISFYENFSWSGPHPSTDTEVKQLWQLANKVAEEASLQLGLTQPSADSLIQFSNTLSMRAHVVVPPLAQDGPEITLRRLPHIDRFRLDNFSITRPDRQSIEIAILEGKSILVSGSTGAGKTSFLTAMLREIPKQQRVLILEDSPEVPVPTSLSTKLVCRTNRFGFREGASWTLEDLVFESLRMRPDRIIVGECRSREARAIRQAMQTGHRGLWCTIHGASPAEALCRFNSLCGPDLNGPIGREWDLVVQLGINRHGQRCVSSIDDK